MSSKPHYPILDGLRGVAALVVVAFHLFEAHATSHLDQIINHGYLAVDFFFLLSGYVIGYAYDDQWGKMTFWGFWKRRLIRLQPLVVLGSFIGAIGFYFGDSVLFPMIGGVEVWKVILIMLIGFTLIPITPSMDIRGWNEMHPLDGPAWSLFFEYIANFLYAIGIRKFSVMALSVFVVLCAIFLTHMAVTSATGDVVGGWSLDFTQLHIGFARMLYPFFAGLLLFRTSRPVQIKNTFLWCSLMLVAVFALPRIGGKESLWVNGLYDSLSIIIIFPAIVYLGACGRMHNNVTSAICKWLGNISYPIYITHYPLIYIYTAWVYNDKPPLQKALPVACVVFIACVVLALASLQLYDKPVRAWLNGKFSNSK